MLLPWHILGRFVLALIDLVLLSTEAIIIFGKSLDYSPKLKSH